MIISKIQFQSLKVCEIKAIGFYRADNGDLVAENVIKVIGTMADNYTMTQADYDLCVQHAETIRNTFEQECVMMQIDTNKVQFV